MFTSVHSCSDLCGVLDMIGNVSDEKIHGNGTITLRMLLLNLSRWSHKTGIYSVSYIASEYSIYNFCTGCTKKM